MMTPGLPPFAHIGLVGGIEDGGGMQAHTCLVGGQKTRCDFVDPGRAQGANWWALDDPTGGARASGEAPLPAPFYVVKRNGYEERHWLARDTGYGIDITARRLLGQNARPRDGQPQSGLQWDATSDLCDLSRPGMVCGPKATTAASPRVSPPTKRRGPRTVRELLRPLDAESPVFTAAEPVAKTKSAAPAKATSETAAGSRKATAPAKAAQAEAADAKTAAQARKAAQAKAAQAKKAAREKAQGDARATVRATAAASRKAAAPRTAAAHGKPAAHRKPAAHGEAGGHGSDRTTGPSGWSGSARAAGRAASGLGLPYGGWLAWLRSLVGFW